VQGHAADSADATDEHAHTKVSCRSNGRSQNGDFPPFIANDVGFLEGNDSKIVIAVFDDHHHGTYSNLEDAVARMTQQVWLYFTFEAGTIECSPSVHLRILRARRNSFDKGAEGMLCACIELADGL